MSAPIIMEAEPGESVHDFAARMVGRAWAENEIVLGEFNQHTLEARPGSTRDGVIKPWDDEVRRSYAAGG